MLEGWTMEERKYQAKAREVQILFDRVRMCHGEGPLLDRRFNAWQEWLQDNVEFTEEYLKRNPILTARAIIALCSE